MKINLFFLIKISNPILIPKKNKKRKESNLSHQHNLKSKNMNLLRKSANFGKMISKLGLYNTSIIMGDNGNK